MPPLGKMGPALSIPYLDRGNVEGSREFLRQSALSENAPRDEYYLTTGGSKDLESTDSEGGPVQIHQLFANAAISQLESGVEMGMRAIKKLDPILSRCPASIRGSSGLSQSAKALGSQKINAEVIIGVVGKTGAGKSSIINSILDEERIVPTNCMRACTAVVTEIAYNHGEQPYTAEIDFIGVDEWKKEMEILFRDFEDSDEMSRKNAKSDFAIAHAKMKAVYPGLEDFLQSSPEELSRHESVRELLGTKVSFSENDSTRFYDKLQSYVDSKKNDKRKRSKRSKDKPKTGLQSADEIEFWPLIRTVRLYVRSPVLSTGAVIVDLPGTQDSNVARSAVAKKYKENCTAQWIVTPITRAVNDKTAEKLLDDSTRTQLKLDCGFNNITFVCTKTDDIRIAEVQESLDMDEEFKSLSQKLEEIAKKRVSLKDALARLQDKKVSNKKARKQLYEQMSNASFRLHDGAVHPKRKSEDDINPSPLKTPRLGSPGDGSGIGTERHIDNGTSSSSNATEDSTAAQTIQELLRDVSNEKEEISALIQKTTNELEHTDTLQGDAEAEFNAQCILERNCVTKSTVQEEFAASVQQIDQKLARNDPDFDPDTAIRDYEALARSLSVFCVSSRAYQVLQGRFTKERLISGFRKIEDTEIKQLQDHCIKSTEAVRKRKCNQFLNDFTQLLNSLRLWSSSAGRTLTDAELGEFKDNLDGKLDELHSELDDLVEATFSLLMQDLQLSILSRFSNARARVEDAAVKVVSSWNGDSDDGPRAVTHVGVYKAICSRSGVYTNAGGSYDWNRDMVHPLLKVISPGWERFFSEKGPAIIDSFMENSRDLLGLFHRSIEAYAEERGMASPFFQTLRQQLETFYGNFADISAEIKDTMDKMQKTINRSFSVPIEDGLLRGYQACQKERGKGCFLRMKAIMMRTAERSGQKMFEQSTDRARLRLEMLARTVKDDMSLRLNALKRKISADYQLLVAKLEEEKPSTIELCIKAEVSEIVKSVESDIQKTLVSDESGLRFGEKANLGGNLKKLEGYSERSSSPVGQCSNAMEGVEVEGNGGAVFGPQFPNERRQEASMEAERNLGDIEGIGTNPIMPVEVKVEENEGTTLNSEHLEVTLRDVSIEAGKSVDGMEGVEPSPTVPIRVKVEETGGAALCLESLKVTEEASTGEKQVAESDSGLAKVKVENEGVRVAELSEGSLLN